MTRKPLWTCPKCGHRFASANLSHSCGVFELDAHFRGRDPVVRQLFDELSAAVEACGTLTMYPQKSRIVFMDRVRFCAVMTRKRSLLFHLWLRRSVQHPLSVDNEYLGKIGWICRFRLTEPGQIDEALRALIAEAYA